MNGAAGTRADVERALRAVFAAFLHVELPANMPFCGHCSSAEYMEELRTTPVMELTDETVFDVVHSLGLTFGSFSDAAHFVPRWCADGLKEPVYEIALAFSKIVQGGYHDWSQPMVESLRNFLMAQEVDVLRHEPNSDLTSLRNISNVYQCLASIDSVAQFFSTWESSCGDATDANLPELVSNIELGSDGRFTMRYSWTDVKVDQLVAWLRLDRIRPRVERAAARYARHDLLAAPMAAVYAEVV